MRSESGGPPPPHTAAAAGIPAPRGEYSLADGAAGPILVQDRSPIQGMAQSTCERVTERVVHAKGSGACGYFAATSDGTEYTKAAFLGAVGE